MPRPDAEPAPLDPDALDAALLPFGRSRMLPRAAYVDETVLSWERRHFFGGSWLCVGRSEDMADAGDQRAVSSGAGGILLVRGADGGLRAFANACRHRGHELLAADENRRRPVILCPYHSWSYGLDGRLRAAPGFDSLDAFDPAEHSLVSLPTAEWHGLVFVDASARAGSFAAHVRGLEDLVAPYEMQHLRTAVRHDYVVAANWKILSENYQECYHCRTIHPQLCRVSPPDSGENYRPEGSGAWVGGWMALGDDAETMSLDGRSKGSVLPGLDARGRREVIYVVVFPNVLLSLHPDYVMTHILTPVAVDRTRVQCGWSFSPEDLGRSGFDPSYAVDFWDITNRQDWAACESVQRGLASPHHVPGPLSRREDGVYYYVTMVARGYRGHPLAAPASVVG